MSKLSAAREYVKAGFALLPIAPGTKVPHSDLLPVNPVTGAPEWASLRATPASEQEVLRWFEEVPDCNIGVICGQASGGLVVADLDRTPPRSLCIPLTPMVETARGRHIYFRSGDVPRSHNLVTERGIILGEIKSDGGYVVLPPSVHPSGKQYSWYDGMSPSELDFADPPEWVYGTGDASGNREGTPSAAGREASNEYSLLAYPTTVCTLGFSGPELSQWGANPVFVRAAAMKLGIPQSAVETIGKRFHCVLPGHEERHPSASLYRAKNGIVMYRDWHTRDGRELYSLAEVRACQAYKRHEEMRGPSLATWQLRLLVETGLVDPYPVIVPALPEKVTPSVRRVYEGMCLLFGCKWLHTPNEPTPFSWRFASAWCGVSERHAGKAIAKLLKLGIFRIVGEHRSGGRAVSLFMPGRDP